MCFENNGYLANYVYLNEVHNKVRISIVTLLIISTYSLQLGHNFLVIKCVPNYLKHLNVRIKWLFVR